MASRWPRIIVHADMDAFYAQIEQRDDPSLRGKPIIVGPPSGRGVVLTASYEARPSGVGSAMPMAQAKKLCPQAIIVPPSFERYTEASRAIMDVFDDFSPSVEALSLDEAFLEMTGSEHIFGGPKSIGRKIKDAVREATGLTVTVGISGTKYVAKVASGLYKPDGLTVIPQEDAKTFLAKLPVSRLWGAGPKTTTRIEDAGYFTIGDIANADPEVLQQKLGNMGMHFYSLANAEDPRHVSRGRGARSIGSERTLGKDVKSRDDIALHLRRSADNIGRRLRRKRLRTWGVRVKLKTVTFALLSRQTKLPEPTDLTKTIYETGLQLLDEFEHHEPYRLVGMAVYDLIKEDDPVQLNLFYHAKRSRLEATMDSLEERFGAGVIFRAEDLENDKGVRLGPNLDFLDED